MKYELIFHPLADKESSEAYQWYEKRRERIGERFAKAVADSIKQMKFNPLLFPNKRRGYREAVIDTYPFMTVFKVFENEKTLFISALYHTNRKPTKKYRK